METIKMMPLSNLQGLLQEQAKDWELHKVERIAELRQQQAQTVAELGSNPAALIPKLTDLERQVKAIELGGAPTLDTILKTSKRFIVYEDVLYELPSKVGQVRNGGKRTVPFKTGARVICTIDGQVSPVYRVLESGKLMNEETNETISVSNAVCIVKTGMTFESYKELNPTFQGFAGWSINNYQSWTELSETE